MSAETHAPVVLALRGSTGGTSPSVGAAWAATIASLATWPADQAVRPVIERRIGRSTASGVLVETVLLALHDPLGVLDHASALDELRTLGRPLMAENALQELRPAATQALLLDLPKEVRELQTLSPVMPEGVRAILPLSAAFLSGLEAFRGRVSFSMLVAPSGDRVMPGTEPSEGHRIRTVDFRVRVMSDQPLPLALRASVEALCVADRGPLSPWQTPSCEQDRAQVARAIERIDLHRWDTETEVAASPSVAAVMLALPGPPHGADDRRAFRGDVPDRGAAVGRVLLSTGRTGTWRMPWDVRRHHCLVAGASGSGKSSTLLRLAEHDIEERRALIVVDPHGDLGASIADLVPDDRLVVIDPRAADTFPLDLLDPDPGAAAAHLASAVAEVWPREFSGPVWQQAINLAMRVLAAKRHDAPVSLADLERFFTNPKWRDARIERLPDGALRDEAVRCSRAWASEGTSDTPVAQWVAAKLTPLVRGPGAALFSVAAPESLHQLVARRAVVVISLPVGHLGAETQRLIGGMLLSRLTAAITAQGALAESERPPISLLIDEAHAVVGDALGGLFAGARKFNTAVTVATQSPSHFGSHLSGVLTNTESMLLGRLPGAESRVFADRLGQPTVDALVRLPKFHAVAVDEQHEPSERPVVLSPLPRLPSTLGSPDGVSSSTLRTCEAS